jgi:hypothetical protein
MSMRRPAYFVNNGGNGYGNMIETPDAPHPGTPIDIGAERCDPNTESNRYASFARKYPPWQVMPWDGVEFDELHQINTPLNNGVETVIFSFQIPKGYDGVVYGIYNDYTGPGFVNFSGDLTWRIRRGPPGLLGQVVRNFGNIQSVMGSLAQPRTFNGGILAISEQFYTYTVTHAAASGLAVVGTFIAACLKGYYWPRGVAR